MKNRYLRIHDQLKPMEALSKLIEANLSRSQYKEIRAGMKNCFPCYTLVQRTKKECYPDSRSYSITETSSEVNLQDLLNITAKRLVEYLKEVFENLPDK